MTRTRMLTRNALSGFLVFLIALPLCLGIALASGFPPVAGVLTAIVGGVLVSHLGSAPLTIKGPAAGLIVIALGAVQELGGGDAVLGYRRALAVGVVAALVQIGLALSRSGRFASIMPPSVVHGMLAAIGVIIIAKQVPLVLGVVGAHGEPLEMLLEIPHYVAGLNPVIALIGAVAVGLLLVWPRLPVVRRVPAPMAVLVVTVPLALAFGLPAEHTVDLFGQTAVVGPQYLVRLPGSLLDAVTFPDFSAITSPASIKYIVMFALVGTVESLLSVIAVDSLDPEKRTSDLDRDLLVTGIGNLVSASIGGLPMISEIVRSKANIDAGATNAWSNFFRGAFLLLFVALVPSLLQLIPLAALAAMLVLVGARLASVGEFRHAWEVGPDQFALFATTFLVTLATDLLVGVGVGLALKVVLHLARGASFRSLLADPVQLERDGDTVRVRLVGPAAFTNLLRLTGALDRAVDDTVATVRVDVSEAVFVDHTVLERLHAISQEWSKAKLEIVGLEALRAPSRHPTAFRRRAA